MDIKLPVKWGEDKLSEFLHSAQLNTYASFSNLRAPFGHLSRIDRLFLEAVETMANVDKWFLWFFLGRAHSAYRNAARLALSGSHIETFLCVRSIIEFSLYALHLNQNPDLNEIWIKRNDSEANKKAMRREFKHIKILSTAEKVLPRKIYNAADVLYNRAIEQGAHPNPDGVLLNLEMLEDELRTVYLHADPQRVKMNLKDCCRCGATSLHIFKVIYPIRFTITGLDRKLDIESQGL